MSKIYIVTTGCYSEYRIEAVFSNHDRAVEYADNLPDSTVEEFDLDPVNPPEFRPGLKRYEILMFANGDPNVRVRKICPTNSFYDKNEIRAEPYGSHAMRTSCWAESEHHAIKIGTERRARLISLRHFVGDGSGDMEGVF